MTQPLVIHIFGGDAVTRETAAALIYERLHYFEVEQLNVHGAKDSFVDALNTPSKALVKADIQLIIADTVDPKPVPQVMAERMSSQAAYSTIAGMTSSTMAISTETKR